MAEALGSNSVPEEVNGKNPHYSVGAKQGVPLPFLPFFSTCENNPQITKHVLKLLQSLTFVSSLRVSQGLILSSDRDLFKKRSCTNRGQFPAQRYGATYQNQLCQQTTDESPLLTSLLLPEGRHRACIINKSLAKRMSDGCFRNNNNIRNNNKPSLPDTLPPPPPKKNQTPEVLIPVIFLASFG